jgi:hypothetical protein
MKKLSFTKKAKKQEAEQFGVWKYEEDHQGKWKVMTQKNGVKVRLLREPSDEYKKKLAARKEASKIQQAAKDEKQKREKLINDKIRELAIAQLEKEGKL